MGFYSEGYGEAVGYAGLQTLILVFPVLLSGFTAFTLPHGACAVSPALPSQERRARWLQPGLHPWPLNSCQTRGAPGLPVTPPCGLASRLHPHPLFSLRCS